MVWDSAFPEGLVARSISVLFENYERFYGVSAREMCRRLQVRIDRRSRDPFTAGLDRPRDGRQWCVVLPPAGHSEVQEGFLIFHELAHLFLFDRIGMSYSRSQSTAEYLEVEAWCDNFAVAMLFAEVGWRVVAKDERCRYFRDGSGANDFDAGCRRVGELITRACDRAEARIGPLFLHPLRRLARDLAAQG